MMNQPYNKDRVSCGNAKICYEDKIGVSIIYAYEDSDLFYPAMLLKHGINCLCFASREPIAMGKKVYILTQDFPIESDSLEVYEGCFAQVKECRKFDLFEKWHSYRIQCETISGKAISTGANELSAEISDHQQSWEYEDGLWMGPGHLAGDR